MTRTIPLSTAAVLTLCGVWASPASPKAGVRGTIVSVTLTKDEGKKGDGVAYILVEGKKDKDAAYDKAFVRITKKTRLQRTEGDQLKDATARDLKKGEQVVVHFTGKVAESYPVKATAERVVILPPEDAKKE